jgi:2-oxoglutarate dehydrogenase E1 component
MTGFEGLALANKDYVAETYRRWKADPSSVDPSWAGFFAGFELASDGGAAAGVPAAAAGNGKHLAVVHATRDELPAPLLGVYDLVHSYRELGHLIADVNPLEAPPATHPLLAPPQFGFSEEQLDRIAEPGGFVGWGPLPVRELIAKLRQTYCRTIGVEYLHIQNVEQQQWLKERIEPTLNMPRLDAAERLHILDELVLAEGFEQFLGVRYPTAKRFSLEGGDALIPMLDELIEHGGALGVEEMVIGMPHRGRLTVLATILRKPYEMILAEFEGALLSREVTGDGDVKYHLGYSRDHTTRAGGRLHLSLAANPSHLEWIDPVIEGMVRAKQNHLRDLDRSRVVPLLMHGDASFTGQGIVAETLMLSELDGYRTGGTIHVIVNNQVGFTAPPSALRFTPYPSDVAKLVQAPVFHVNGDDPEAAVHVARLAMAFRQRFKKDVIIDLVCYRRHGHNELDEPTFTQPVMYRKIASHPTTLSLYRQ